MSNRRGLPLNDPEESDGIRPNNSSVDAKPLPGTVQVGFPVEPIVFAQTTPLIDSCQLNRHLRLENRLDELDRLVSHVPFSLIV
jgi:hypothetical protein